MGILSWLRSVRARSDAGFMLRDGKQLRWSKSSLPVEILVRADADRHADAILWAARAINDAVSGRVVQLPVQAINDVVAAFADPAMRRAMVGPVLVALGEPGDDRHGHSDISYDTRTGEIRNVLVTLPATMPPGFSRPVVLHEMLHALGLDHDEAETSIMHRRTRPSGQQLLASDVARLRSVYR